MTGHPQLLDVTQATLAGFYFCTFKDVANTSPNVKSLAESLYKRDESPSPTDAIMSWVRLHKERLSTEGGQKFYHLLTLASDPELSYCSWAGNTFVVFTKTDEAGKKIGPIGLLADKLPWLSAVLKSESEKPDASVLLQIIRGIDRALMDRELETLDEVLLHLPISTLHPVTTVAFIRNTFIARAHLVNWTPLVHRFKAKLLEDARPLSKYLRGMEDV